MSSDPIPFEQRRQHPSRLTQVALRKSVAVRRLFRPHVYSAGPPTHVSYEAGRRLDYARGPDSYEQSSIVQCPQDEVHFTRHLPKPADVRTYAPAALAARQFGRRLIGFRIRKRNPVTAIAAALE